MTTPLAWFDLPHDADERELKRAYAKRLKETRPDVDPQGFQLLRSRYEAALAWCRHRSVPAAVISEILNSHAEVPATPPVMVAPLDNVRPASINAPVEDDEVPRGQVASFRESVAENTRFDVGAFVSDYLQTSTATHAAALQEWLQERQDLWSLHHKQLAGRAIIQRLFMDPPPMAEDSFDITLAFFDLDNIRSGIDPFRIRQLRDVMQDRLVTQRRAEAMVQDWGANPHTLDVDALYEWLCLSAIESSSGQIEILLQAQPALRSLSLRRHAAPILLERLCHERPPMPTETFELLVRFFQLSEHVPEATRASTSLQELPFELEIKWLTLPGQLIKLSAFTYVPGKPYAEVLRTKRNLHWASKPFHWWWVICISLMPGLPRNLGFFFWRLSGGVPSRLSHRFDPRMVQFFLLAGDRGRFAAPRFFVGALRCAVLLALAVSCDLLWPDTPIYRGSGAWGLTFLAVLVTVGWAGLMATHASARWQAQPEEPVAPLPLLRLGFVPALAATGLVWTLRHGATLGGESLMLALAWIAYIRLRARHPQMRPQLTFDKPVVAACSIVLLSLIVVPWPIVPALAALTLWIADLIGQGRKLRFSRTTSPSTD